MFSFIPRPATKKPMGLLHVQYLTKVRRSSVQPSWVGKAQEMEKLRAEAAARNKTPK
jgi:hypothetical protein